MNNSIDIKAVAFMLLSTFTLAFNGFITQWLTGYFEPQLMLLFRVLLPALVMLVIARLFCWQWPSLKAFKTFALRAVFIVLCQGCFIYALIHLSLVEAVILFSTGPLFIPVIERLVFQTQIDLFIVPIMLLMLIGMLLQTITEHGITFRWELLIGLAAGFFNACSQLTLFRASKIDLPLLVINGWCFFIAALLCSVGLSTKITEQWQLFNLQFLEQSYGLIVIFLLLLGLSTAATQFFRSKAYRLVASNSQLAPLIYTSLVFALMFQLMFIDVQFHFAKAIGSSFIVVASMLHTFRR